MSITRCERGHFYDDSKYTQCPHCRIVSTGEASGLREDRTVAMRGDVVSLDKTVAVDSDLNSIIMKAEKPKPEEDPMDRTVSVYSSRSERGVRGPAGWLVCVDGPDCGRDFRLTAGRNFAGRSPGMEICLASDTQIHRSGQFSVIYDPKSNRFTLMPGEDQNTFLNGEMVSAPAALREWDRINAGESLLIFRSFCGEEFKW